MYFRYEFFGSTGIFASNKEMEMKYSEKQWLGYIRASAGFNMGTEACPGSFTTMHCQYHHQPGLAN